VVAVVMRFADSARMSLEARNPKDTPAIWLPTGCEMFMLVVRLVVNRCVWATGVPHRTLMFPVGSSMLLLPGEEVRDRKIRV